jgi:hypothetical protein
MPKPLSRRGLPILALGLIVACLGGVGLAHFCEHFNEPFAASPAVTT